MAIPAHAAYQPSSLESAILDLVRVGTTGHAAGVRQVASRLVRQAPTGVLSPEEFRAAVHAAMSAGPSAGLRLVGSALPRGPESEVPLVRADPHPDGSGLSLDSKLMAALQQIIDERKRRTELARVNLEPASRLLLTGPPGVGKTLTANWIAEQLGLPLVSLDLAAAVSSYLGSSGRNIHAVFEYARAGECVLLLDEFDAIAPRRDNSTDVGELRRLVNVVLLELENWSSQSLLIAATNHRELLDPAIGRRFDLDLQLTHPDSSERSAILSDLFLRSGVDLPNDVVTLASQLSEGLSGSDIARGWRTALRRSVMRSVPIQDEIVRELLAATGASPNRGAAWLSVKNALGWSNRKIADAAGVTHPTVGAAIRRSRGTHE